MPDPYHPYQQYQNQYQDPRFGQSHDEGTIEEHIHRSVNKRVNHSRTPVRDVFEKQPKAPLIVGAVGIVIAVAALCLLILYKGSATAQMGQMQHQLTAMSQQLQAAQEANATSYNGLSGKVSTLGTAVDNLNTAVSPWNTTCAQALESQNGPGTYYFPCSNVKP